MSNLSLSAMEIARWQVIILVREATSLFLWASFSQIIFPVVKFNKDQLRAVTYGI